MIYHRYPFRSRSCVRTFDLFFFLFFLIFSPYLCLEISLQLVYGRVETFLRDLVRIDFSRTSLISRLSCTSSPVLRISARINSTGLPFPCNVESNPSCNPAVGFIATNETHESSLYWGYLEETEIADSFHRNGPTAL